MARASNPLVDATILDAAGSLFARHGFAHTSVQAIADSVGLSKAGLLHHFPTKETLYTAVLDLCHTQMERIRLKVSGTPEGEDRDRSAIRLLVDLALIRPGLVALLLGTAVPPMSGGAPSELEAIRTLLFRTFDDEVPAISRTIRVMGAMGALGVLTLAAVQADEASAWREPIIAASFDALGH